jgi:hypothetical protein
MTASPRLRGTTARGLATAIEHPVKKKQSIFNSQRRQVKHQVLSQLAVETCSSRYPAGCGAI